MGVSFVQVMKLTMLEEAYLDLSTTGHGFHKSLG
jgi:hypothetical protein